MLYKFIWTFAALSTFFSYAVKENVSDRDLVIENLFKVTITRLLILYKTGSTQIELKRNFAKILFVSTLYTFIQRGRPTRINDGSVIKTMQRMMPHLFSLLNNEEEEEQKQPTRHLEKKSASSSSSSSSDDEEPQAK